MEYAELYRDNQFIAAFLKIFNKTMWIIVSEFILDLEFHPCSCLKAECGQRLHCNWFIWEVIPGNSSKESGVVTHKRKETTMHCIRNRLSLGSLGKFPLGNSERLGRICQTVVPHRDEGPAEGIYPLTFIHHYLRTIPSYVNGLAIP